MAFTREDILPSVSGNQQGVIDKKRERTYFSHGWCEEERSEGLLTGPFHCSTQTPSAVASCHSFTMFYFELCICYDQQKRERMKEQDE
ncbi:hypothetical protein SRHO_G00290700 [Serrasalmus rhombeus]